MQCKLFKENFTKTITYSYIKNLSKYESYFMLISSAKGRVLLLARNKAAVSKQGQKIFYSYFIFQVSSEKVDNRAIKEALLL